MAGGPGKLVGIDLGTTFCAVATLDDHGQPVTLPNRDGEMLTPSAVVLPAEGEAVVGQSALDVALEQPDRVASLIKRRMGYPNYGRAVCGRWCGQARQFVRPRPGQLVQRSQRRPEPHQLGGVFGMLPRHGVPVDGFARLHPRRQPINEIRQD